MRIVFFGTPEFAVPSLRALLRERYAVVGVVTQPDRPQGRSRSTLVSPPVKVEAERAGITVLQPDRPLADDVEVLEGLARRLHEPRPLRIEGDLERVGDLVEEGRGERLERSDRSDVHDRVYRGHAAGR